MNNRLKTLCSTAVIMAVSMVFADQYADWFKGIGASPTSISALNPVNGEWSGTSGDGVSFADSKIVLDDVETPISFTIGSATKPDTEVVDSVLIKLYTIIGSTASLPAKSELVEAGAQLAIATAKADSTAAYYAWLGGDSWLALSGATPVEDTEISLLVDTDYSVSGLPKARFSILTVNSEDSTVTTNSLTYNSSTWLALTSSASSSVRTIAGVKIGGNGKVAKLDGSVRLGVATAGGVKYPTVQAAVDAAAELTDKTVSVYRTTDENASLDGKSGVVIAGNGNYTGTVTVPENQEIKIAPAAGEFTSGTVTGGSGTYTLSAKFSGGTLSTSSVTLPDEVSPYKEVSAVERNSDGQAVVTLRTKDANVSAITLGGKALTVTAGLRTFLYNKVTAYTAPESSTANIKSGLEADGKNSLPVWQSYVLGLDPATATSTPKVEPIAKDASASTLQIQFPNIDPPSDSGYTVTYRLYDNGTATGTEFSSPSAIALPLDSSVHAYTIKPVITATSAQ